MAHRGGRLHPLGGVGVGDVAVFYRTNAQSRALEEELVRGERPLQGGGGHQLLRPARSEGRHRLPPAAASMPATRCAAAGRERAPAWCGDASVDKLAGWAGLQGISFGDAVARADEAGVSGRAGTALIGLTFILDGWRSGMAVPELIDENGDAVAPVPVDGFDPDRDGIAPGTLGPGALVSAVVGTGYRANSWPTGPSRPWAGSRSSTNWSAWPMSTGPHPGRVSGGGLAGGRLR